MAKALTAAALDKFKADPEKRLEIPDGLLTGLYFVIQPSGGKSWAVRYRYQGKPRKLAIGRYPAFDLAAAREAAKLALRKVQEGADPAAEKQEAKASVKGEDAASKTRFDAVVRTFLVRYAKPKNRSWKETARQIGLVADKANPNGSDDPNTFVAAKGSAADLWGQRQIASIKRAEVIELLDGIVDRGSPVMANRVLAALRKLFNWSLERDLVEANPCDRVKPPAAEKSRDRVLSNDELRALWLACDGLGYPFGSMFKALILTGQRREEVASMAWREIDTARKLWTLPRERVKTDKAHDVPLSDEAVRLLDGLPRVAGSGLVFTTTGDTPVSGFSKAKATADEKMLALLREWAVERGDDTEAVALEPWRLHDIRRTVASGMAGLGIGLPVIEKILNHTSGSFGGIVGVYQRHEFSDEKRRALDAWGRYVMTIVENEQSANILPFRNLT